MPENTFIPNRKPGHSTNLLDLEILDLLQKLFPAGNAGNNSTLKVYLTPSSAFFFILQDYRVTCKYGLDLLLN